MSTRLTALGCLDLAAAAALCLFAAATVQAGTRHVDRTWSKTHSLRSAQTRTYTLRLPDSFERANSPAAVGYTLYPRTGPGFAVSQPIGRDRGAQPPYLGVTVLRSSFNRHRISVTVKTSRLSRAMALELSARGSA
jgi:hypothetical protein